HDARGAVHDRHGHGEHGAVDLQMRRQGPPGLCSLLDFSHLVVLIVVAPVLSGAMHNGKSGKGSKGPMRHNRSVVLRVLVRGFLGLLLLAVLAYPLSRGGVFDWPRAYDPLALPDLDQSPNFLTDWQLRLAEADPQGCVTA